jgi:Amt family ammonium transporter
MNTSIAISEGVFVFTLALLMLAPLAIGGVALINTGLGRSKSAAQAMLGNLAILAVASVLFALIGASLSGVLGGSQLVVHVAGKPWNVLGQGPILMHGFANVPAETQLTAVLEFFSVIFAAMIPWGSGADRLRITAGCAASAIIAAVVFPLAAHWMWNGGWLASLGLNFQLGAGFLDPGGAATIHALGGLGALATVWIVGPRRGKFPKEGLSTAMPGHNAIYVLFGSVIALVGWMAWNVAGAILWLHAPLNILPITAVNTLLSASGALATTFALTQVRFGKPDASLCANGWLAGLVASSASAALTGPIAAIFIGVIAGAITPLLVELLELALSIDDPSGAVTVHTAAAFWGLFAAGMFAPQREQILAQLVGISVLLGIFFPLIYLLFAVLNRIAAFRVVPEGERVGMDLHELGGGAYPEFVIHRDDSFR